VALPPGFVEAVLGVAEIAKSGFGWNGTTWIPLTGARLKPFEAVLGIAESVKLETFGIVSTT